MRSIVSFIIVVAALAYYGEVAACTSAIVTAERSSEGAPLLWKNRDSSYWNTCIKHVAEEGCYAYTSIVANTDNHTNDSFGGINERGFGIINVSSPHLPSTPKEEYPKGRTVVQYSGPGFTAKALKSCATVEEFEKMLRCEVRTMQKRHFSGNYGVADATGAAAYFEIWDTDYRRYDISEQEHGFDVRANFSWAADPAKMGTSRRRYDIVMQEMTDLGVEKFSPHDLIHLSRSYNSVRYGDVLLNESAKYCQNHTVPRHTSIAAVVLVCDGTEPRMLVINGHPVAGVAVPVYVRAKESIPQCVATSEMVDLGMHFCSKAYTRVSKRLCEMNKEVISEVLNIPSPKIVMPRTLPKDIKSFNKKIDKSFTHYKRKVKAVLSES